MYIHQEPVVKDNGWKLPVVYRYMTKEKLPQAISSLHFHDYIELLYCVSGKATVIIDESTYEMTPNDLVIIPAHGVHDVFCKSGSAQYHVVRFLPQVLYGQEGSTADAHIWLTYLCGSLSFCHVYTAQDDEKALLPSLFSEIAEEFNSKKTGYELIVSANVIKAVVLAMRKCAPENPAADMPESLRNALEKVLHEAHEHLCDWSATEASRYCGLSYSYFSRNFKLAFGVTFSQYMETLRLRQADYLLKRTEKPISEIAESLGFVSASYFIERFRQRRGITPLAFRNGGKLN